MTRRFLIVATLILACAVGVEALIENKLERLEAAREREAVSSQIATLRADFEKEIVENLSLIYGTANFLAATPDMTQAKFSQYVEGVFALDTLLLNMAAAPDFIMTYVHPLAGNRAILGRDYRALPEQWEQVRKVRDSGRMVVAGPIDLIQGGRGIIGRAPVFVPTAQGRRFWGIVSAVINTDRLFVKVGVSRLKLRIALRGVDGEGEDGATFFGDETLFSPEARAVRATIKFPSGTWVIAATPMDGWSAAVPNLAGSRTLVAGFTAIILLMLYRAMREQHNLMKTRESLKDAQAIARMGSWELDLSSGSIWCSEEVYRLHGIDQDAGEASLATLLDTIHPDDRDRVDAILNKVMADPQSYSVEHRIVRPDGEVIHVHIRGMAERGPTGRMDRLVGTVLDVTERTIARENLLREQLKMKAMAEASYDAFTMVDSRGHVVFWSPAAERMFGWTADEAVGREIHDLIAPLKYHEDAKAGMKEFARTGKGAVMESIMEFDAIRKDGTTLPVERSVSAFRIDNEHFAVGILRDITERKRYEEELKQLARMDRMTGVFNRGYFAELALKELGRADRFGHPLSLIMFDADKFKVVNDTYGHNTGDKVLVSITATVRSKVREIDLVGRLGGEEFAVLLPETDLEAAKVVAEKLRLAIQEQSVRADDGTAVTFTVSLGIAEYRDSAQGFEALLKLADQALYKAKTNGRNRWEAAD